MEFSYELTGLGWASATLTADESQTQLTASYLSDPLGWLLRALRELLDGADTATCVWEEEPGEYLWMFERAGDRVLVRISGSEFIGTGDDDHDDDDEPHDPRNGHQFESNADLREFASVVVDAAEGILARYGRDGYLDRWVRFPFPDTELDAVRRHLNSHPYV